MPLTLEAPPSTTTEMVAKKANVSTWSKFSKPVSFDPLNDLKKWLNTLLLLPEDWSGDGSISPSRQVVINVLWLVDKLPKKVQQALKQEDITPTSYGTISLDWRNSTGDLLSVEMGIHSFGYFSAFQNAPEIEADNVPIAQLPQELVSTLHFMYELGN